MPPAYLFQDRLGRRVLVRKNLRAEQRRFRNPVRNRWSLDLVAEAIDTALRARWFRGITFAFARRPREAIAPLVTLHKSCGELPASFRGTACNFRQEPRPCTPRKRPKTPAPAMFHRAR